MDERSYKDIKISCPHHDQFFITHGCTNLDCNKEIVFCSSCLIEHLEHVNTHKAYLCTLNQFIIEFSQNIFNVRENLRPFQEVYSSKGDHLSHFQKFINDQKEIVHNELKTLCENFYQQMERVKASAFEEIDKMQSILKGHYDELAKHYESQEIGFLNFHQHWQLAQQLAGLSPVQVSPFLKNIRASIQALKNPDNSFVYQNLMRVTNIIQSFKKQSDSSHINLVQHSQKAMKTIHQEVQDKIMVYVGNIVKPIENAINPLHKAKAHGNFSSGPTSSYYGSQLASYYESPVIGKVSDQMKRGTINVGGSLLPGVNKFTLEIESILNYDIPTSTLCVSGLSDNLFATGSKDCIVRIIGATQPNELRVVGMLQDGKDPSPIWSLCKINCSASTQPRDSGNRQIFIAGGLENGNISMWRYDMVMSANSPNHVDKTPEIVLEGGDLTDIVSAILDLEDGSTLLSGDSNGSLVLWNYASRKVVQKFNIHTGQINSICFYNSHQNIAVGGYDGILTLWEIKKKVVGAGLNSNNTLSEPKREIVCIKIINNNFYIYSLMSVLSGIYSYLIIADSENKCKIFDPEKLMIINESEVFLPADPIVDNLHLEVKADNGNFGFLMCFTKNQMFILDESRLDPVQLFDNNILYNNNVGITLSNCNKTIVLGAKEFSRTMKGTNMSQVASSNSGIYLVMIDQNPKSNRLASLFKLGVI